MKTALKMSHLSAQLASTCIFVTFFISSCSFLKQEEQVTRADLGRYEENDDRLYAYERNAAYSAVPSRDPYASYRVGSQREPYQRPYQRNAYEPYKKQGAADIDYTREAKESSIEQGAKDFFSNLYSGVKDFFVIPEKKEQQTPSARASMRSDFVHQGYNKKEDVLSQRNRLSGKLHFPVNHPEAVIASGFGWRKGQFHEGIDIAAPYGTVIEAALNGKVLYSGDQLGSYGKIIVVQSDGGIVTVYGHNSKLYVQKGDVVERGQVIALLGQSGNATGPHLHFEVRLANQVGDYVAVQPEGLLR